MRGLIGLAAGGDVSFWKRIERAVWTGEVLHDYGTLSKGRQGPVKRTVSALLTRKKEQDRFIIKASYVSFFAASVQYSEFDREAMLKLKVALDDAVARVAVGTGGGPTSG